MKTCFYIFLTILFLSFISLTKEDTCEPDEMSISALGKCHSIEDFLSNKDYYT